MIWQPHKLRTGNWSLKAAVSEMEKKIQRILNSTKHSLVLIFRFLFVKGNLHYIMPGARALQKILREQYGICVGIRWIYQCMADLEALGLIRRKPRPRIDEEGNFRSRSSMIVFTASGLMYLKRSLIEGSAELWKKTLEWIKRNDQRFPSESELTEDTRLDLISNNLTRVRKFIKDIG